MNFTLTVVIAMYMQNIMAYTPFRAGISYVPLAIAMALGQGIASRLVTRFAPRVIVVAGGPRTRRDGVLSARPSNPGTQYFPYLVLPIVVGVVGMGIMNVALGLSLISSVGIDRIGPTSAIAVMLQNLGGPLVLVGIQVIITIHTLHQGGTTGPVRA